jgi:hypothetical protein
MHPTIKEFWIKSGHPPMGGGPPCHIWEVNIHLGGPLQLSRVEIVCHGDKYRYNNQWYSEEEMLRIIELKAFL